MKFAGMGHPIYEAWHDSQIARARGLAFSNGGSTFNPVRNKRFQLRINGVFLRNGLIDLAEILHAQISAQGSTFFA